MESRDILRAAEALAILPVLCGALAAQPVYTPYDFATLAGIYGNAVGPASSVRLNTPRALAVDGSGNVYIAEGSGSGVFVPGIYWGFTALQKVTPGGLVTTVAGGSYFFADGTGTPPVFGSPSGMAADGAGNVYIADGMDNTVLRVTPAGMVTVVAGSNGAAGSTDGAGAAARFSTPNGLALDGGGNLYVADTYNGTIRKITPGGLVSTLAGTPGVTGSADGTGVAAQFNYPDGVAVDAGGNVYVADTGNSTIRRITPGGMVTTVAGTPGMSGSADGTGSAASFDAPAAVAADAIGNIYVVSLGNYGVRRVTPAGVVTTLATHPNTNIRTNGIGLAVDKGGSVYVADNWNAMVWRIAPDGLVTAAVGNGNGAGSSDGTGSAARFDSPDGVAVDRSGNVYVADSRNGTIRMIAPGGVVTTLAGQAGRLGSSDGTGAAATFAYPVGIAVDNAGNLYVTDNANQMICKVTPDGTVSTLAGHPVSVGVSDYPTGNGDGTGAAAEFGSPFGIAVDADGNLIVADAGFSTIRKVTPRGVVTTLAGTSGFRGAADGTGVSARFNSPCGLAIDGSGNVYVADAGNNTIRKMTAGGVVTTLAGTAGPSGNDDGTGAAARFDGPNGIAVGGDGTVYVADTGNNTIRRITPGGAVTTLAGAPANNGPFGVPSGADGIGPTAQFNAPAGLAVDAAGNLYVADSLNNTIRLGAPGRMPSLPTEPSLSPGPASQTVATGGAVVFSASSATVPQPGYQWYFDGVPIAGATNPTLVIRDATAAASGEYCCTATNPLGVSAESARLSVVDTGDPGRLVNLSCRAQAGTGAATLIAGFVVGGTGTGGSEPLLIRASGPALAPFGVPGVLLDPQLTLNGAGGVIATNNGWAGNAGVASTADLVGAFAWADASSHDSALVEALPLGPYTAQVAGASGDTGVALAEVYDATPSGGYTPASPRLVNLSARDLVGTGGNLLIAGFVIGGTTSKTVLIRASGPALGAFGLQGTLPDPELELFQSSADGTSTLLQSNTGWGGDSQIAATAASVGAFSWGQAATADSALLVSLPPGAYTVEVLGARGDTGIALIEIYEVP